MENDNVIPMSSRAIDLPQSPFRATSAEGELLHAPVVATLMHGKTIAGRLAGVDGPRAIITLQTRDKRRTYVRFSELRYLNFITRNPINRSRHPLQEAHANDIVMPKGAQDFRITFSDQKVLSGRTRSSFVDKIGIHLFQLVDSTHVTRLFIPTQAVSRYYIGRRRDSRGEDTVIRITRTGSKIDADITPRRRKSDRHRQETATDTQALRQALASRTETEGLAGPRRVGEMLVEDGIITQAQLDAALESQKNETGARIGEILVKTGATSAEQIYTTLAHKFGLPFVLLRNFFIDIECLNLVPVDVARKYMLVPLLLHDDRLVVAMDDPANTEALTLLHFMTQYRIEPTIATREDIEWALGKYYGRPKEGPLGKADRARTSATSEAQASRDASNRKTMEKAVASFIANTVADAVDRGAADIHLVTEGNRADMLFRIDGELVPVRRFSRIIVPAILDHLRAMGAHEAQSGSSRPDHARVLSGEEVIDAHIEITRRGDDDNAVIRLIRIGTRLVPVAYLGLQTAELAQLEEILTQRGRLILVAGPNESHRSRTLYAALREIRENGRRVATAEWPVSYYLNGIEQIHPHGDTDDFATQALHGMDAGRVDCLLIGEIIDRAGLDTAVAAALRGTTVLAKLDAATAVRAITRLTAMTGRRTELATVLGGILVQHRLRVNCRHCLTEEKVEPAVRDALGAGHEEVFYHGAGCEECQGTGYSGSQLVFELLPNSLELTTLMEANATSDQLAQWMGDRAITTLQKNALELARLRRIPLAEAHRLHLLTRD